ncbi:MAG: DNA mismatch repair endonuclease MutL [Planctomycetota bacterium]|jgi:DNA mismatch repair protein MutL|nr:DNA mismatch repair endonuclease MutL [Planctomycetota bacterium]
MSSIQILPITVQNKIAAGEVIERPASVVKELAENAMDAGARHIAVELEEGGRRLIRVSDDGSGMDGDDLVQSMQRHATSKIRDVDDIFRIASFGFRGEALPSIGSVSRMAITTCLPGAKEGHELTIEGGRVVRLSPAAPRKGTSVEVRDIFFNTPARRKFLSQPASENTRAADILTRLALGNPGVGFRLQTGDRITLSLQPAADQMERIRDVFGDKLASRLVPFGHGITEGLAVGGFFAKPPESRRNSRDIYILVNRRWIRYFGLARAVADSFQGILPPREYPFAIINLTVDPARVDVNAHPAKEEVRFESEGVIISGVKRSIREALAGVASLPTAANLEDPPPAPMPISETASQPLPKSMPPKSGESPGRQRSMDLPAPLPRGRSDFSAIDLSATRERLRGAAGAPERRGAPEAGGLALGPSARHRVLGQAGGRYILVDGPDGLLLVDPHALHERWNFDRLVEERQRGAASARLLIPLEMRLSPAEAASAGEAVPLLAEYGFECSLPDPERMVVAASPSHLPPARLENMLRQVLADVGEAGETLEASRERLLASLACRSSVLLGTTLPEEEMLSLLGRFFNQGQMPTCPHGRPTAIRIGWDELARRFGR